MLKKTEKMKSLGRVIRHGFTKPIRESLESSNPQTLEPFSKGFTFVEMIMVIVILAIVSLISINFLVSSLKVYTMTVNQKSLFDEGKLALERMCRDIRDARSITSPTPGNQASAITFTRTNATPGGDGATENIKFDVNGINTLQKNKNTDVNGNNGTPYAMASNVNTFTVTCGVLGTHDTNQMITLLLTLSLASGEKVTLQTIVYPKNLPVDGTATYKNFCRKWREAISS